MNVRLCHATTRSERTCLDSTYDVRSKLVSSEVVDEAAGSGVIRADDGPEQCLHLVQATLEREDVSKRNMKRRVSMTGLVCVLQHVELTL